MNSRIAPQQLKNPWNFLALGFGSGLAPVAPGTFGTLAAIPVYLLTALLPLPGYLLTVAAISLIGITICGRAADNLGVHDHPAIVWDEIAGYLVTMVLAPAGWFWIMVGFVLFRIFDILKPWPIRVIDNRVSGGMGIMLDDIIAGVFACACLQLLAMVLNAG